ncbi:hypothetical protein NQT65_09320 [Pseudoalteromonas agarivorans]|uniref:hypothetical protein n=1 Tax=Pseudoalteromonas TaxID=53246 RepID=UPI000F75FC74|nr:MULTISPECIES: hypothetical protein [Pseudoalteromonas]AZN34328.1 hypothetical protein EJ103_16550 [Pseudoalteromonas sp. Xi13]MCQ8820403.1 hypothetical protein [Pseudoalteromonas agarivorans]
MKQAYLPKNKPLNLIVFLSALIFISIHFFSSHIPSVVPWGQEFEDLVYRLSFSIIPSYIFYFIVVHQKSNNDKKNLEPLIAGYNSRIINIHLNLFNAIHNKANVDMSEGHVEFHTDKTLTKLTEESIENTLKNINIYSDSPKRFIDCTYMNWVDYLIDNCQQIENAIDNLMLISAHLDSVYIKTLYNIKTCELIKIVNNPTFRYTPHYENTFILYKKLFHDFNLNILALKKLIS